MNVVLLTFVLYVPFCGWICLTKFVTLAVTVSVFLRQKLAF